MFSAYVYMCSTKLDFTFNLFVFIGGLNDQFPVYRSIVDYLCKIPKLGDKILLNYIHIMSDVYEGLKYFAKKNLVHGDIKRNIQQL